MKTWIMSGISVIIIICWSALTYIAMSNPQSAMSPDSYLAIYIFGFIVIGVVILMIGTAIESVDTW